MRDHCANAEIISQEVELVHICWGCFNVDYQPDTLE